jgi:hypothetical protein
MLRVVGMKEGKGGGGGGGSGRREGRGGGEGWQLVGVDAIAYVVIEAFGS